MKIKRFNEKLEDYSNIIITLNSNISDVKESLRELQSNLIYHSESNSEIVQFVENIQECKELFDKFENDWKNR